jgi:heme-degrading monooxygenase HmoA
MFARLFQAEIRKDKATDYNNKLHTELETTIKHLPGFLDLINMTSTGNPERVAVVSFWRTQEDAENYHRNVAPRIHESLKPFLKSTPTIETFNVDTTTGHKIAAAA